MVFAPDPIAQKITALRVLVVDDFSSARHSLRGMLANLGVRQIMEAADAQQASVLLRHRRFDIIICDYNLGDGQNGLQLMQACRAFRTVSFQTLWVLVTADTSKNVFMGAIEAQPDDYLGKPFAFEEFRRRLRQWVERLEALHSVLAALDEDDPDAVLETVAECAPANPRYRIWLEKTAVRNLVRHRRFEAAAGRIEAVLQHREQEWALVELARIRRLQSDHPACRKAAERALVLNPTQVLALDELAASYAAEDHHEKAQALLLQAVHISPLNLTRQRRLGQVSRRLRNFKVATKAFRESVALASGSHVDNPMHYVEVAQTLNTAARMGFDQDQRNAPRQTLQVMRRMIRHFPKSLRVELKGLLLQAEAHHLQGKKTERDQLLRGAFDRGSLQLERVNNRLALDMAESFMDLENQPLAEAWLSLLRQHRSDDPELLDQLLKLENEPPAMRRKKAAQHHNRIANQAYRDKQYRKSLTHFLSALEAMPEHPGILLNIAQSHVRLYEQTGQTEHLAESERFLAHLGDLAEDHYQYDRLQMLKKWHESVKRAE